MKYYHGSKNGDLTKLTLSHSNDGYIYLTPDYATAVFYGGAPVRFWWWDKQKQMLIVREMCKNGLKKMYKHKSCYVYSTQNVGKFENDYHFGRPAIKMEHNVDLTEKEFIPDVYKKLIELKKQNKIEIFKWNQHSKEQKQHTIESIKILINQTNSQKYPDDWAVLCKLYPHLCKQTKK